MNILFPYFADFPLISFKSFQTVSILKFVMRSKSFQESALFDLYAFVYYLTLLVCLVALKLAANVRFTFTYYAL